MNRKLLVGVLLGWAVAVLVHRSPAEEVPQQAAATVPPDGNAPQHESRLVWRSDYRAALAQARQRRAMALVWFVDPKNEADNDAAERDVFRQPDVAQHLDRYVLVKLTLDAAILPTETAADVAETDREPVPDRKPQRLLDHAAFAELLGQPGIALIDLRDEDGPHHHQVVSVLPLGKVMMTPRELAALLTLPDGSLTQRTLIWAVRTHPDRPLSASREANPLLMSQSASHAAYQAELGVQGHHDWGTRFERINGQLPADLVAQEVCAESWPGQRLVEAAQECVHSWRQSPGHWDAVSTAHPLFGYDMQRGANGIWYATGIFGRKR